MKKIAIWILLYATVVFAQNGNISGTIQERKTNLPLSDVNIVINNGQFGTTTNTNGEFAVSLPEGTFQLTVTHIGYKTVQIHVTVKSNANKTVTILLDPVSIPVQEIMVTSTKYETQLQNVPMPVSVITEARIKELAPIDIASAMDSQAGISIVRDGIWGTAVNIRGLSRNNVVILVDGNRIDTANDLAAGLSMIDINDVERVEVIKGAASSLYGSGAVGGAVNIYTKDGWYNPAFYIKGSMMSGYTSVNNSGTGQLSLKTGSNRWYMSLSGMVRQADNTLTPQGEIPNSQFSDDNISAKAGIIPFTNHEFKINYQRYHGQDIGIPGGYPLFPDAATVRYPEEKRELKSVEYSVRNLNSVMSKMTLKYFTQDILRDVENIPHQVNNVPAANGQPAKTIYVTSVTPRATHKTSGVQYQSDFIFGKHQHFILGLDAWQKDLDSKREKNLLIDVLKPDGSVAKVINQVVGERPLPVSSYNSTGLYAQDEINLLNKKLTLQVGGRYDMIRVENEQVLNPVYLIVDGVKNNTPSNQVVLWKKDKANDHSWSGNFSALYHLSPQLDLTTSLGRSFRSPFLEERYQYIDLGNLVKIGDPNLKSEEGTFGDAGIRIWMDKTSFSINGFYNKMNNLVVETPAVFEGRNALKNTNIGKALLYGFDTQASYSIVNNWEIYANAAWVHGQDTFHNTPLPLIPPFNGKLGIIGHIADIFRLELNASLYAKQDRIASWETESPGYTTFNGYLSTRSMYILAFDNQFFLGVENIGNKAYRNHLSTNRGQVAIEPGRNVFVRWQLSI